MLSNQIVTSAYTAKQVTITDGDKSYPEILDYKPHLKVTISSFIILSLSD